VDEKILLIFFGKQGWSYFGAWGLGFSLKKKKKKNSLKEKIKILLKVIFFKKIKFAFLNFKCGGSTLVSTIHSLIFFLLNW